MAKQPCEVVPANRQVIEHKLLESLEDGAHVAIVASKKDLDYFIAGLLMLTLKTIGPGKTDLKILLDGLQQLESEAFK